MIIPAIYTSPRGTIYLEHKEISPIVVETLEVPSAEVVMLDKRELITSGYKKTQLPPDMRKWDSRVRETWLRYQVKQLYDYGIHHPLRGSSSKLSSSLVTVKHILDNSKGMSETFIPQVQNRYSLYQSKSYGEAVKQKPIKSRRIKQKIARKRYADALGVRSYVNKPPRKELDYPETPRGWPLPYLGNNLGEALAMSNYRFDNLRFVEWYEREGKFLNCSTTIYYQLWLGVDSGLTLRHGDTGGFYARQELPANYKPWGWPYAGVVKSEESKLAILGEPRPKDKLQFLSWLSAAKKLPLCASGHTSKTLYNCSRCAELAYKDWWKGK